MSDLNAQIQAKVEAFVEELSELVRQAALERVSEALGTPASSSPKRRGRPAASASAPSGKAGKRSKGQKRSAEEMADLQETLLATIEANPGARADQLAEAFEVETRELALPIKKLLAENLITKKGQKRATTYYAK